RRSCWPISRPIGNCGMRLHFSSRLTMRRPLPTPSMCSPPNLTCARNWAAPRSNVPAALRSPGKPSPWRLSMRRRPQSMRKGADMRFLFYTHSLVSDWNHGNAHFLRGVMRELIERRHEAIALEPEIGGRRTNLLATDPLAFDRFERDFPHLNSITYDEDFYHEAQLPQADVMIVHGWTDPSVVARIGRARRKGGRFTLIFHDTHRS